METGLTWRLLVDAARTTAGDEPGGTFDIDRANWTEILWFSRIHRLAPAVHDRIHASSPVVPDAALNALSALARVRRAIAMSRLAHAGLAVRVASALRRRGIPALIENRWALSQRHHVRPDLAPPGKRADWLVPLGRRDEAVAAICEANLTLADDDPLALTHFGSPRLRVREADTGVFADADAMTVGGERIAVPSAARWLTLRHARLSLASATDTLVLARAAAVDGNLTWPASADNEIAASVELLGVPWPGVADADATAKAAGTRLAQVCRARGTADDDTERPTREAGQSLGAFAPTPAPVVDAMLQLAGVTSRDTVYDLGCGDGRVVIRAATAHGAKGVGIDLDPRRIDDARAAADAAGVRELVSFIEGDAREQSLADATVVCLYLQGFAYDGLAPWLRSSLRSGCRVVSHTVAFHGWPPSRIDVADTPTGHAAYVFVWELP